MISVLLASRERLEKISESLASLGDNCEFLIAIDEDDSQLAGYQALQNDHTHIYVFPRYGYVRLEDYYNELARRAKGDWLLNWNDDAIMQTPNWQDTFADLDSEDLYILTFDKAKHFPVMSRGMYETLGRFSGGPGIDSYMLAVGTYSETLKTVSGVEIAHQPAAHDSSAATRQDSPIVMAQRYSDVAKVWMKK